MITTTGQECVAGTTLRAMMDEFELVEDVKRMLKQRVDFDRQYVKDLRLIRSSFNSKNISVSEGISSLLQPILTYFDDEIEQRETINQTLETTLTATTHASPNDPDDARTVPTSVYEEAKSSYDYLSRDLASINTSESVAELREWRTRLECLDLEAPSFFSNLISRKSSSNGLGLKGMDSKQGQEESYFQFPPQERRYRQSTFLQNVASTLAAEWHERGLLAKLDKHQTFLESARSTFGDFMRRQNEILEKVVKLSSLTTLSIAGFSSPSCIAPKKETWQAEKSHHLLQPKIYKNLWNEGAESIPVFSVENGLTKKLISAGIQDTNLAKADLIRVALEVEQKAYDGESLDDIVKGLSKTDRFYALVFNLLVNPPLLFLDKKAIADYKHGLPREKIMSLFRNGTDNIKGEMPEDLSLILQRRMADETKAIMVTHRKDAVRIVKEILKKWDFPRKTILPDGVVNNWKVDYDVQPIEMKLIPMWKKTGTKWTPGSIDPSAPTRSSHSKSKRSSHAAPTVTSGRESDSGTQSHHRSSLEGHAQSQSHSRSESRSHGHHSQSLSQSHSRPQSRSGLHAHTVSKAHSKAHPTHSQSQSYSQSYSHRRSHSNSDSDANSRRDSGDFGPPPVTHSDWNDSRDSRKSRDLTVLKDSEDSGGDFHTRSRSRPPSRTRERARSQSRSRTHSRAPSRAHSPEQAAQDSDGSIPEIPTP